MFIPAFSPKIVSLGMRVLSEPHELIASLVRGNHRDYALRNFTIFRVFIRSGPLHRGYAEATPLCLESGKRQCSMTPCYDIAFYRINAVWSLWLCE